MASKELSALASASTLDGTELVHVVQGGNSRKAALSEIRGTSDANTIVLPTSDLVCPNATWSYGTQAAANGYTEIFPFVSDIALSVTAIGVVVTTASASSNVKVVVYGSDGDKNPIDLLLTSGAIDTSSTGNLTATVSFTFQPKRHYWVGVHASGTPTLRVNNQADKSLAIGTGGFPVNSILQGPSLANPPSVWGTIGSINTSYGPYWRHSPWIIMGF